MAKRRKTAPLTPNNGAAGKDTASDREAPNPAPPKVNSGWGGGVFLPLLILLYLLLAGTYSAFTPAATADQHNPDENAHLQYVATLASGHLPVFTNPQHGYENHQPPLYYALCAPVYLAAHGQGDAAATKAVRWVSILLGALLIGVTFRCVAALFPNNLALALAAAAFVGLLPSNVALSASMTNDSLTTLVIAVGLWQIVRLAQTAGTERPPREWRRQALWLGVTLGIGVWTKTLTLSLFPTVLLAFLMLARSARVTGRQAAEGAGLAAGLGGLIGLPWLLRNTLLYGDPLTQHLLLVTLNNGGNNVPIDQMIFLFGGLGGYFSKVAQWGFASFWGGFDSMRLFWDQNPHKPHPNYLHGLSPTYQGLLTLCAASGVGLTLRWRRGAGDAGEKGTDAGQKAALAALGLQIVFTGIAFLNYNLHFFQAQGRYLYPALLPLAFFFVWGWQGLLPRPPFFSMFVGLLTAGLLALNLWTLFGLLLPRFA